MRRLGPRLERWIQDGVLQLQRRAYEGDGQGMWQNVEKEVPTMSQLIDLQDFDVERKEMRRQETGRSDVTVVGEEGGDSVKSVERREVGRQERERSDVTVAVVEEEVGDRGMDGCLGTVLKGSD